MGSVSSRRRALQQKVRAVGLIQHTMQQRPDRQAQHGDVYQFIRNMKKEKDSAYALLQQEHEHREPEVSEEDAEDAVLYEVRKEVVDEVCCSMCEVALRSVFTDFTCRVCPRVFHRACLQRSGLYGPADVQGFEAVRGRVGWSCPTCENITLLMGAEDLAYVMEEFDEIDKNNNASIDEEEFVAYKRKLSLDDGDNFDELDEAFERRQFRLMDVDGGGCVEWWEFVQHAATRRLARRDQRDLVRLLTDKEKVTARTVFDFFDPEGQGRVPISDLRQHYRSWYTLLDKTKQHSKENNKELQSTTEAREMDWKDFLNFQAIYIISSRPNLAASMLGGAK